MHPQHARPDSVPTVSIVATIACAALVASAVRRMSGGPLTRAESWVVGVSLGLALASVIAMLLAAVGTLRAPIFAGISLAAAAALFLAPGRDTGKPASSPERHRVEQVSLLLIFALGVGLRALPMDNPLGGRDPGSYTLRTEHTLRSGDLAFTDELLAEASALYQSEWSPGLEDLLGSFPQDPSPARQDRYESPYRPGFYLADREKGRVEAQFFHLYPSTLAVGGFVFGPERLHWLSPLLALLWLGTWSCISLRAFNSPLGRLFAITFLALNPLAIWTSRQTLTETSYGLWLSLALLLCLAYTEGPRLRWTLAATFFLACATWTRGDAWVWGPLVAAAMWSRERETSGRAPLLFVLLFAAGIIFHAHFSFAYLHDELLRRWPRGDTPSPALLSGLALAGAAGWQLIDQRLDSREAEARDRVWSARVALLVIGLIFLVGLAMVFAQAGRAPFSRMQLLVPAAGGSLLLALPGVMLGCREGPSRALAPYLVFGLIAAASMVLFIPRQLPTAGLYYYGRYLVPVAIPTAVMLGALWLDRMGQSPRRRKLALAIGLMVVASSAFPLATSAQTLMNERRGAREGVAAIAAELPDEAIVIAGGDGWHRGFTFNQVAGALAMSHGVHVLPYRDRERSYAVARHLLSQPEADRRPVYLLINEASHHYTRPDDERIVAGADDLLSAPLRAKSVHHFELWLDYLTPDPDWIPTRITRDGLRMSLVELSLDAAPARQLEDRGKGFRFEVDDPRGAELFIQLKPGQAADAVGLRLDKKPVQLGRPGLPIDARASLGPFRVGPGKHRLSGAGIDTVWLLPPPTRASAQVRASAQSRHHGDERGHPVKNSAWTSALGLSRFRAGFEGDPELRAMSLRVRPGAPIEFPRAWLPGVDRAPKASDYDVIATLTGSQLAQNTKLRITLNGQTTQDSEPPRDRRGSWQTPKLRWSDESGSVRARIELVGSTREDEWVDIRDLTFFLRDELVEPQILP
jgi:hypothetical protein